MSNCTFNLSHPHAVNCPSVLAVDVTGSDGVTGPSCGATLEQNTWPDGSFMFMLTNQRVVSGENTNRKRGISAINENGISRADSVNMCHKFSWTWFLKPLTWSNTTPERACFKLSAVCSGAESGWLALICPSIRGQEGRGAAAVQVYNSSTKIQFHCDWRKQRPLTLHWDSSNLLAFVHLCVNMCVCVCVCVCVCMCVCVCVCVCFAVPAVKCLIVNKRLVYLAELLPTQQMLLKCWELQL